MKDDCFSALLLLIASVVVLSAPNSIGQGRQMGGIGITVFADPNFRGKSATYRNDVANLDGTGLNDKITSLRVGPSERWEICEHANYQGRCVVVSDSEPDLRRNSWSNIVSSLRRVNGGIVLRDRSRAAICTLSFSIAPHTGETQLTLKDQLRI